MSVAISKGKAKANDQTPLLTENGTNDQEDVQDRLHTVVETSETVAIPHVSMRDSWRSYLLTAALAFLTILIGLALAIILLADSYAAPALQNVRKALADPSAGERFWKEAVLVGGPDSINVTSVERRKVNDVIERLELDITVAMRIAVDTDFVMGFHQNPQDSWWRRKWKSLGQWGVGQIGQITVVVDQVGLYSSILNSMDPLVTVKPLTPIDILLRPGLSPNERGATLSSLKPVSMSIKAYPSLNASMLLEFFEQSWSRGFLSLRVRCSKIIVHGGHEQMYPPKWWQIGRWKDMLSFEKEEVRIDFTMPMPPFQIPSHPPSNPGSKLPNLADLIVLESFNITSAPPLPSPPGHPIPPHKDNVHLDQSILTRQRVATQSTALHHPTGWNILIFARASLPHPFKSFVSKLKLGPNFTSLPFTISLPVPPDNATSANHDPELIPVSFVHASPTFNTTHVRIALSGYVLPFANASENLPDAISTFVSSYLSYRPSAIFISTPLYPSLVIHANFPPPPEKLELLRNVSVEDMSIYPGLMPSVSVPNPGFEGDALKPSFTFDAPWLIIQDIQALEILASATVHARVVLPRGMDIDIRVTRIWIDCLVYDGKVPELKVTRTQPQLDRELTTAQHGLSKGRAPDHSDDEDEENAPPLPEPLPLPVPLPPHAFGRITPRTWLKATSTSVPRPDSRFQGEMEDKETEGDTGASVYVTARVVDVPLVVLPGRQGELSKFVTKVLFSSDPVIAGISGIAAVGVTVPGLTSSRTGHKIEGNELILSGLPFEGNVLVGGKKLVSET